MIIDRGGTKNKTMMLKPTKPCNFKTSSSNDNFFDFPAPPPKEKERVICLHDNGWNLLKDDVIID